MIKEKIKFFINKDRLMDGVCPSPLLFPFLKELPKMEKFYDHGSSTRYGFDTNYYELVDMIEESDFVFIPYRYNVLFKKYGSFVDKYIKEAHEYNKPVLIDGVGDIEESINIKDVYVLKIGGYRFNKKENEIIIPTYSDDLLKIYSGEEIKLREKKDKPVVGFAGWASLPLKQRVRTIIKELPVRFLSIFNNKYKAYKKGVFFREEAVLYLQKSDLVKSNLLIRRSFSGNKITAEKDMEDLRKEFVDNLLNSDYGLVVRGDANASTRFYETMSMGRIPLLVDTECNFPFDDIVNYKDFCVFVDFRDLKNIDKILFDFHKNLTPEKFKDMQIKAREAYINYFRTDGLTIQLMNKLREISKKYKK